MLSRTIVHESCASNSHWRCHFQYYASAFIYVFRRRRDHIRRFVAPVLAGLGGFQAVWGLIGRSTGVVVAEESGAANFGFGDGADLWGRYDPIATAGRGERLRRRAAARPARAAWAVQRLLAAR